MSETATPSTPRRPRRFPRLGQIVRTFYRLLAAPLVVSTVASVILGLRILATDRMGAPLPGVMGELDGLGTWVWLNLCAPLPAYALYSGCPRDTLVWRGVRALCALGFALCLVFPAWTFVQSLWWMVA